MKKWKSQERGIDQENMPEEVTGPSSGSPRVSVTLETEGVAKIQSSLAFVRDTSPMPESSTSHNIMKPIAYTLDLQQDSLSMERSSSFSGSLEEQALTAELKKKRGKKKKPNQYSRINYSPIPGKQPTTMDAPNNKENAPLLNSTVPLSEVNNKGGKKGSWVSSFWGFRGRSKSGGGGLNPYSDRKDIEEVGEEHASDSESLEMQSKFKMYGLNNKVTWKRLAVTSCPSMQSRNKILDQKLRTLGKRINVGAFDLCPSANPESLFEDCAKGVTPQFFGSQSEPIDINENDFKVLHGAEFEGNTQPFDVYQLEQLVMLLKNPFSSVNVVAQNGIVIGFVCPESTADDKKCIYKCDESFRFLRQALGLWRCKAFTEFITGSCKLIRRKQSLHFVPFMYETWWFSDFVEAFKLDREVSLCTITPTEVANPEKPWTDGNDTILVLPLDKGKPERRASGNYTRLQVPPIQQTSRHFSTRESSPSYHTASESP